MTVNDFDDTSYNVKNKIVDTFKPYILEIKDLNKLSSFESCKNDIDIVAKIGEVVKIVFDDDSAKNELTDILLQMTDKLDAIYSIIDNNDNKVVGKDIRQFISYIPNKLLLNNGSIKSNIINGKENITIERINEICKFVGLSDYVAIFTQGIDTLIDNDNMDISNVNKYKIVMARELINDNSIIIFDEPDLFLNGKTKSILNSIIKFLYEDHIVLILTKLDKELELNEKTIKLYLDDKVKINENIVFDL